EPRTPVDVLYKERVPTERGRRVIARLKQAELHDEVFRLRQFWREVDAQLLPVLAVPLRRVKLGVTDAGGDDVAVGVGEAGRQAGPGIGQRGRLAVHLDVVVRP